MDFFGAPAAIFCFIDRGMGPPQWSDLEMFLQTFMLLAEEAGWQTCPQEYWSVAHEQVRSFTNVSTHADLLSDFASGVAALLERTAGLDRDVLVVLVVVNMGGGNDALNTVVPVGGSYYDLRPNVRIEENELLMLDDTHGFHPALVPLMPHWNAGQLAVMQGIGFDGQTRSHFAATDAIFAGHAPASQTGWIGRWLDRHPQASTDPLLAVALGGGRNAVVGETAQATVISNPEQFLLQTAPGMDAGALTDVLPATAQPGATTPSDALAMVRAGIPNAVHAVNVLDSVARRNDFRNIAARAASILEI